MTHARQTASLRQNHTNSDWWDTSHTCPHGSTMGGDWPERTLRFGRTKKISGVTRQRKDQEPKRMNEKRDGKRKSDESRQLDQRRDKKRDKKRVRKLYPLRGRGGNPEEELSCQVLLTRLEEGSHEKGRSKGKGGKYRPKTKPQTGKTRDRMKAKSLPKAKLKSKHKRLADYPELRDLQPRKRRLASLNAEAVNSLLLERPTDAQPAAKQARRQEDPLDGAASLDPARSSLSGSLKASRGNISKVSPPNKVELCQSPKPSKKAKTSRGDERVWMSQECLDAPAPRRLAGLNAAALLKLTSSSATSKQRVKAAPTATVTSNSTAPAAASTPKQQHSVKLQNKHHLHKKGKKPPPPPSSCSACKKKADFEPKVEWETGSCTHRLTKPGYQSRSMLGFPLKQVKEEQLETELSPYYCCPPEGSVEYCHRLACFLGQQPYGDSDDQSLNSAMTPVKPECLVTSPSLTHSHPHRALALTPHPCLCTADHCFPGYYVHITHPTHTGQTSAALATRPLNFSSTGLCPSRITGSKLLGGQVSHPSGLGHPAYCNSVASPCYGDACGISGYSYRALPPVTGRGCSFSAGCTGCTHSIKTEAYTTPQGDHSPSLLVPPTMPIAQCPLSSVPTSTQTKSCLLTPLSGRDQPQAMLKLAKECPQSTKASNGSSVGHTRLLTKQATPVPSLGSGKQKKISRRRATNGWRPVGIPTEREVFIAGEDEAAMRRCYEGVERDGEVIHVRDTVLLRSGPRKKSLPYVAKISALWEDPKTGELMMSLFWYYRPEHTQGGRDPRAHCENEIFASRHQDENSVACIEDRCYVLPLAQYCRFCALVKRRAEGAPPGRASMVPFRPDFAPPSHRCVPTDVDPELVYLCRHVYDFRYGRILKNLQ
ncbi:PREDICTED: bromo adjacent homology domain-containing 1 protein-like isoform X2 [Poecilia mexicana]|uniref:BAH domain-containing protein n=3 Tax=Poecilia mexicana TaxID=48701 RepID=A0A3B3Y320_9TELE|nr:PREDICTED: bromo adjacent homology domain-containing 1 protein-like isoform X2 [Poecilia mexicana]